MYAMCSVCGQGTLKEEVCYKCRVRPSQDLSMSRAEVNLRATIEQGMTEDEALDLYNDAMRRIKENEKDKQAWHDKRRAKARLFREVVDEATLI